MKFKFNDKTIEWNKELDKNFLFDLTKLEASTLDDVAQNWAIVIANFPKDFKSRKSEGVKSSQLRKFYDKIDELYYKSLNMHRGDFQTKVLPFVKMVRSKVYNAKNKSQKVVNEPFVKFMEIAINQIDNQETLKNFKFLFEAVVGFYQTEDVEIIKKSYQNNRNNYGRGR
jgi:CRISPR type III-A-associated protein Csm2